MLQQAIPVVFIVCFIFRLITVTPFLPSTFPQYSIPGIILLAVTPLILLLPNPNLLTFPLIASYTLATLHTLRFSFDPREQLHLIPDSLDHAITLLYVIFFIWASTANYNIFPSLALVTIIAILTVKYRNQQSDTSEAIPPTPVEPLGVAAPPSLRNASIFTLLTFSWVSTLISTAHARSLQLDDILPLSERFNSINSVRRFCLVYQSENRRSPPQPPSLLRILCRAYGLRVALVSLVGILRYFIAYIPPILLRYIILHIQTRTPDDISWHGVYLSCTLFASLLCQTLVAHQFFDLMCGTITTVRGALNSYVYSKFTRLSVQSRTTYTSGQIQNLMATDALNVAEATLDISFLVTVTQQFCIIVFLLYNLLGWIPTMAVVVLLLAFTLLEKRLIMITKNFQELASSVTDERVKLISEAIKGIKLVKLYAWECAFVDKILHTRDKELGYIRSVTMTQSWNAVLVTCLPTIFILAVFGTHIAAGNSLDAAVVFPVIAAFNIIRPILIFLPAILLSIARAAASLSRLERFFNAEEIAFLNDGDHAIDQRVMESTKTDLAAHEASFAWDATSCPRSLTLTSLSFQIPEGSLVAIVGPTGSGKSSLLAAMLGELPIVAGKAGVRANRSISFCDQVPFIQNATLRENILFGKDFDDQLYWSTIRVCSLEPDLEILPAHDHTEIGGRGVNLSGGQKARLSLARAMYSRADICLLDDPLCAVDARVGKSIFSKCIVSALRGTTRLLTTNQIQFAASPDVDLIIFVKDGRVVETGSRDVLLSRQSSEFAQLIEEASEAGAGDVLNVTVDDEHVTPHNLVGQLYEERTTKSCATYQGMTARNDERESITNAKSMTDYGSIKRWRLTKEETMERGRVRCQHYGTYLRALGLWRWVLPCILFAVCTRALNLGIDLWLSSGSEENYNSSGFLYLMIFLSLGSLSIVTTGCSIFSLAHASIRASGVLHKDLLLSVFGAPTSFFQATPDGRIINRFHSDMDKVDSLLAPTINSVLRLILNLAFTIGIMLWATPWVILFIAPAAAVCVYIQEYYRRCSIDVRRLESIAKSPLYSHFIESLDGIVTIRAYNDVPRESRVSSDHSDTLGKVSYATYYPNRWLGLRLESVGSTLVFMATSLAILSHSTRLSASKTGLLLSYVIQILGTILSTVRQFTFLESHLSSVERISEYSAPSFQREEKEGLEAWYREQKVRQKLSGGQLTELKCDDRVDQLCNGWHPKALQWPKEGRICFKNVAMRYRADLEPSLKDILFAAEPGEHIGIVGRTGAGKSSTIHCLFRLHELEKGSILVDGRDISELRLYDLRSSIGIIPQEPVCFSGTIWSNLDMSGEHDETDVQMALDTCGLQFTMSRKVTLLDEVAENGSNLSTGQRQLLCLGRVLLKDSQILVLDEATSNVTNETDEIIQRTLRERMKHCTILTIAHRLHTVMRSDRIIIMDKGKIVEIGKPHELLNRKSKLSALVDETGPATAARLRFMASSPTRQDKEIVDDWIVG